MTIFVYDYTFDGLLTCVFEAYANKLFPNLLVREGSQLPLFCEYTMTVTADENKSLRVWNALRKKLSATALAQITYCWLSETDEIDNVLFRYICKNIDAPTSIEMNFADEDVLFLSQLFKKVSYERMRMLQFIRFQKAVDGTYFAPTAPVYNVLPISVNHFQDRFNDQAWLIYDTLREYGFYYNLDTVEQVTFKDSHQIHLLTGKLSESMMDSNEKLFQDLWKTYFNSVCIKERLNPRKHKQDMPIRYWKYITEKQR